MGVLDDLRVVFGLFPDNSSVVASVGFTGVCMAGGFTFEYWDGAAFGGRYAIADTNFTGGQSAEFALDCVDGVQQKRQFVARLHGMAQGIYLACDWLVHVVYVRRVFDRCSASAVGLARIRLYGENGTRGFTRCTDFNRGSRRADF